MCNFVLFWNFFLISLFLTPVESEVQEKLILQVVNAGSLQQCSVNKGSPKGGVSGDSEVCFGRPGAIQNATREGRELPLGWLSSQALDYEVPGQGFPT